MAVWAAVALAPWRSWRAGARQGLPPPRAAQAASPAPEVARGKYVFGATGGCGCHTEKDRPVNSGGRKYDGPFGTVYSTNITPDRQTGIGGWTDEQIITAIRLGRRPNGERLLPVHPYHRLQRDGRGGPEGRRRLPPDACPRSTAPNQPKKITVPLFESVFLPAWLAAFAPRETPPPTAPTARRGARRVSRAGGRALRRVPHAARP